MGGRENMAKYESRALDTAAQGAAKTADAKTYHRNPWVNDLMNMTLQGVKNHKDLRPELIDSVTRTWATRIDEIRATAAARHIELKARALTLAERQNKPAVVKQSLGGEA